jgi:hypothetical protein
MTHEQLDQLLNLAFPGICSKLLDSILRSLNEYHEIFDGQLSKWLESVPYGFGSG